MAGSTEQPFYCSPVVTDGIFFLSIPATFCEPHRPLLWLPLKPIKSWLSLMWPQWQSELQDMRQCPQPATTAAHQSCSQICPTCCGPPWLTPAETTCAQTVRSEKLLKWKQRFGRVKNLTGVFLLFCPTSVKFYFPLEPRCWRQWRHQDKQQMFQILLQ